MSEKDWKVAQILFNANINGLFKMQPYTIVRDVDVSTGDYQHNVPYSNGSTWQSAWAARTLGVTKNVITFGVGKFGAVGSNNFANGNANVIPTHIIKIA